LYHELKKPKQIKQFFFEIKKNVFDPREKHHRSLNTLIMPKSNKLSKKQEPSQKPSKKKEPEKKSAAEENPASESSKALSEKGRAISKKPNQKKRKNKLKYGCKISKIAYVRDHVRKGSRELPLHMNSETFYNTSRVPSAPTKSCVRNFTKKLDANYRARNKVETRLKNSDQPTEKTGRSTDSAIPLETDKKEHSSSAATLKIVHAMDTVCSGLFSIHAVLSGPTYPASTDGSYSYFRSGLVTHPHEKQTKKTKTITHSSLYKAWLIYTSNQTYIGPKMPSSLRDIESVFALYARIDALKEHYNNRKTNPDEKKKYNDRKNDLLVEVDKILDTQCHTHFYVGEGLKGALKRYLVGRSSKPIGNIMEVIARVFVGEIMEKANKFTQYQGKNVDEKVISYCLNTCGFKCDI